MAQLLKAWTLVFLRNGCPLKETEIFLDLASTEIEQPQGRSGKNKERRNRFEEG